MTDTTSTLPARALLLAFDRRKQKLTGKGQLGHLLRAAALAELVLHGHLTDDGDKAHPVTAPPGPADSVLRHVWDQIEQDPPRAWRRWVAKDRARTMELVHAELVAARVVRVERHRVLGLFPATRVTLRQPHVARRLGEQVGRAVRGSQPVGRVDREIGALAALASAAQLAAVFSGRERRRFTGRIGELGGGSVAPVVTALRKAVSAQHTAAAHSGGGNG
ncbi:GPP34 family phosphoprotein [Prauserella sp. ASG 168]|uniref:GPP34 family phosphoprotein n=2 Tax=Prauserella cavernicola TaxID=2800127 RepID=A0A934QNG4_9PSEU|nr:GPP34 family phosphoprotein [Prauserella cavernicola]